MLSKIKIDLKTLPLYLIYIAPTVHLAFGKRFGDLFNILTVLCLINIYKYGVEIPIKNKRLFFIFLITFFIYPLEIFISQLLRWQWRIHDYMDQIRFIFAFPVFLYLINKRVDLTKYIEYSIPVALILSFFTTKYLFSDTQFGDRFTNNFTDPLAYGQICLSMSMLLIATFLYKNSSSYLKLYKVAGILFGIYISVKTESRTGWIAFPIAALIIIYTFREKFNFRYIFLIFLSMLAICYGIYQTIDIVHLRLDQAFNELLSYPWHGGMAPETSVGLRITFWRLGWFYITHNPWYGMGDKGFINLLNSQDIMSFASKEAITISYQKLFHNELITQTVRYGLLGFIGYIAVLIIPFVIFFKEINNPSNQIKHISLITVIFLMSQIVAGVTDEVLNLKYMVLYFMLLMSISYSMLVRDEK
ncbi:MAG: O-antigen ligase family protein [Betaproteobacteria bacterium]|nr:O-antigen ligase family protein [Betaproteobacteria bacterium]